MQACGGEPDSVEITSDGMWRWGCTLEVRTRTDLLNGSVDGLAEVEHLAVGRAHQFSLRVDWSRAILQLTTEECLQILVRLEVAVDSLHHGGSD